MPLPSRRHARGFTYLGILFAIVILGLALAAAGTLWSLSARRDREAQLLWTGAQYQRAIASYYLRGPGGVRQYPGSLAELLEDRRGPVMLRHLRRLYPDPMTGTADWALDRLAEGSITGVRSRSAARPLKQAGFSAEQATFEGAECVCDWAFNYVAPRAPVPGAAAAPSPGP